jgi:hypothetical protein
METYEITFTTTFNYDIEAESSEEAVDKAYKEFLSLSAKDQLMYFHDCLQAEDLRDY